MVDLAAIKARLSKLPKMGEQRKATTFDVLACYDNPALMSEYRRLTGSDFGATTPLASAIDHATGHFDEQATRFFAFVYDVVWIRLPPSARREEIADG